MKIISLKEIKLIHSRNNILNENIDEMNNFKKTYSYKTINLKGNPKTKFLLNLKKANSILWKKPFLSNLIDVNNKTPFNKQHSFNFRYMTQKIPSKFSLYTILAMKKNNIYDKLERIIQPENNKTNKISNINIFKNKEFVKTQAEIGKKNQNILESRKKSMIYLSYFQNNFNESEKIRFYSMMKKLSTMKYILEIVPNNKNKIIKNFLLKEGIFDKKYFNEDYYNNFIKFIKNKKAIINPSLTFKENLIQILNNNLNYSLDNFQNYQSDSSYNKLLRIEKIKNIMNLNETIYRNKNTQFHTLDNFSINRFDLDLKNNLDRQTLIRKRAEKITEYDIKKEPEKIMDSVGIKLNKQINDVFNTAITYKLKKNPNDNQTLEYESDYDIFKRKNLVTEYACFNKAKDNYDFKLIKTKYNL